MKKKKRNNLGYYIKEGVSSIFTHGFMSFASVVIIMACLIIMGSFLLIAFNVNAIIDEAESRNQVLAYVDDQLEEDEARALERQLLSDSNVESVEFVSRDDAFADFASDYDDTYFDGIDSDVLRHRYVIDLVEIAEMEATQERLMAIDGIDKVNADTSIADWFVSFRNIISVVFIAIVAVLLVISIFIMSNTIKLATFDRREEIAIMRMVGATNSFIRWPFVFQGFILGVTGAIIAFVIEWALYEAVAEQIMGSLTGSLITVVSFSTVTELMILIFLGTGFVVGTLGSAVTIRNYLKV